MRTYVAIDLKSFYASVECADRGLDALTTNLVVADKSRTDKTICLAVSPSLKSRGVGGRARLFEVVQRVREINKQRQDALSSHVFAGKSCDDMDLKRYPQYELDYIVAPPRMTRYMQVSAQIYAIYLKYVAPEDIHVYSCDEVFIDVTAYLKTYRKTARELVQEMIYDVLEQTHITATAGIGTNLYLCKVAMDVMAKKMPADKDGVRIAELDEMSYRLQLWNHRPLTDFWRMGHGIASRLEYLGIDTMGKLARMSLTDADLLYKMFGVSAELIIDHAWGYEPCTMEYIKNYRSESHSLSSGQVLKKPYTCDKARVVVREMVDSLSLDLVEKGLVTDQLVLTVGYDTTTLGLDVVRRRYFDTTQQRFSFDIVRDHYGRLTPKHAHGTAKMGGFTASGRMMDEAIIQLYDRVVTPDFLIRRLNICANHVVGKSTINEEKQPDNLQLDLFIDHDILAKQQEERQVVQDKEHRMQQALLRIKHQYGKNVVLRASSYTEGATARERNEQIGGHKA